MLWDFGCALWVASLVVYSVCVRMTWSVGLVIKFSGTYDCVYCCGGGVCWFDYLVVDCSCLILLY